MDPRRLVVLGGESQEGGITIYSKHNSHTAVHEGDDGPVCRISCSSKKNPDLSNTKSLGNTFIWCFTVLGFGFITVVIPEFLGVPFWLQWFIIFAWLSLVLFLPMRKIAKWHAAEHMAIYAYTRLGSTDLAIIRRMKWVNDLCGTRFLAIFVFAWIFAPLLTMVFYPSSVVWWWLILVGTGFIMEKYFKGKPFAVFISRLIQHFFTTKEPDECALRTAQAAMICYDGHSSPEMHRKS